MTGRGLSSAQRAAAQARHRITLALIEFDFRSGPLYLARAPWDVVYDGKTYIHAGIEFEQIRESSGSIEGVRFSMSGLNTAVLTIAHNENITGRTVRILKAYVNPDTNQIIDAPVARFIGRMKSMPTSDDNQSCTVSLFAEHYEAELERPAPSRLNDADQQRFYPGDRGAEFAETMVEKTLVWPKADAFKR